MTVYETVCGVVVLLESVCVKLAAAVPVDSPVTFGLSTKVQEYVVPVGTMFPFPFEGVMVKGLAEQTVSSIVWTKGFGST